MKLLQCLVFSFFLLSPISSIAQPCDAQDSVTVTMLYNSLNVPTQTGPVHSWIGIDTISFPGYYRVSAIDLSGQGLNGIVPDSLFINFSFEELNLLDLSNNAITDIEGPLFIFDFCAVPPPITAIYVDSNSFSPSNLNFFDYFLAGLPIIDTFSASAAFSGSSALKDFEWPGAYALEYLNLNGNLFTDTLFYDTIAMHNINIQELHCSDNNLTAIASSSLPSGSGITIIKTTLNNNQIINLTDIEQFIDNTYLLSMEASSAMDTSLHASLDFNIAINNYLLQVLDLSHNNFEGPIAVNLFEQLDSIQTLLLNDNLLSGPLPLPSNSTYTSLNMLKYLDLSNNNLSGEVRLDWLFSNQINETFGVNMPLDSFFFHSNNFETIGPNLDSAFSIALITGTAPSRFSSLNKVNASGNNFDFIDLHRLKEILRFKQITTVNDHFIPQAASAPSAFVYNLQNTLGIGGLKRRTAGDSLLYEVNNIGLVEIVNGSPNYLNNRYTWERLDTMNLAGTGGSPSSPFIQFIGSVEQSGSLLSQNLITTPGQSGIDPSFQVGLNTSTLENITKMHLVGLDSLKHANWLYRTAISNDSFPALTLYTYPKKIEVGPCVDASGMPIICQSMIVQFDPALLASMTTAQQDSMKLALRESLGATPIEVCLCGDLELWEISDTASAFLEAFGKGTRSSSTSASAKPQLLSADPDYGLLSATGSTIPSNTGIPAGSGDTSSKTLVAIIDSGLDYAFAPLHSHISEGLPIDTSCIKDAVWGYNFLGSNNNASDDHGHGTAVAGIVAGISKNNIVPTGSVTERIGILPLKYTDKHGKGSLFHASCALRFAADYERLLSNGDTARVRVINTSWGFLGDPSSFLENALKYVGENCNILVVSSAGNDGNIVQGADSLRHWPSNSIFDPADTIDIDNVIGVGAIDAHSADQLASYSNYGNIHIDLAALGTDSTANAGSINGYDVFNGTSFAAPQVSRVAGLLFDKYPDATYFAMKYALMNSVDKLQSTDSLKLKTGGRLNYAKADSILNIILDRSLCNTNISINGIKNIKTTSHELVNIYPNPVSKELNIDIDPSLSNKSIKLSVFNAQGQCLLFQEHEQGSMNCSISTKDFAVGVYYIQFQIEQQHFSKKFLKI